MFQNKGNRALAPVVFAVFTTLVVASSVFGGYELGRIRAEQESGRPSLSLFWEVWDKTRAKFYGEIDTAKQVDGAISGMVAGLGDPFTNYLPPSEKEIFLSGLDGNFGGIGAELELRSGLITVVAPLEGTPADRAGIKAGDIIIKIDGEDSLKGSFNEAILRIRGEVGTKVTLSIIRAGEAVEVELTRETIVVKSVATEYLENDSILYLKINQFGGDTKDLVTTALTDAKTENVKGMVLDLRNNPGGYLPTAQQIVGMLIPDTISSEDRILAKRTAVVEKDKDGKEILLPATSPAIFDTLPIMVLINNGSASASEILAGALRDYGRATIIGEQSYGKGSVQDFVDLSNGGSIKVTIAHWLTPKGNVINKVGLKPDVELSLGEDEKMSSSDSLVQEALKRLK